MRRLSPHLITKVGVMMFVLVVLLAANGSSAAAKPEDAFNSYGGNRTIAGEVM